jgi:hypothetical protein
MISAIALFDYTKTDTDEISFSTGDEIIILNKSNLDWWEGRRLLGGDIGYFPANRVQVSLFLFIVFRLWRKDLPAI